MYKFKIAIDVIEDDNGIHQDTTISGANGGAYNKIIAIGALEMAKLYIYKENQKE